MDAFGYFIERKRKEKGFNKSDIYRYLGITQNTYDGWLEDPKLSLKAYIDICNFLNIDPAEFFYTQKNEQRKEGISSSAEQKVSELIRQNGVLIEVIKTLSEKVK